VIAKVGGGVEKLAIRSSHFLYLDSRYSETLSAFTGQRRVPYRQLLYVVMQIWTLG
jgi:hypothetical protein